MKIVSYITIAISLIVFCCSCSSVKNKNAKAPEKKLDLELDKEVEDKFVVKDTTKKKSIQKDKVNKKEKSTIVVNEEPKSLTAEYPADFPQQYKDYDKEFKKTWSVFDSTYLKVGEKVKMGVSYLGLGMGSMNLEIKPNVIVGEKEAFSFAAKLKTASFYSYIYELDDSITALVEKNEFLPLKYELIQRESKKEIDDIQLFDQDKKMLYYRYRRWRKDKKTLTKRKDDIFIPKYSIDPFSLLYFVRGLPLKTGRDFSFPIVTRNKLWVVKVVVGEKESIKTVNGKKSVYKVTAQIGEGGSFIKKGAIELWFDTAPGHMLWKLRVGTKIGSLYAKVEEFIKP